MLINLSKIVKILALLKLIIILDLLQLILNKNNKILALRSVIKDLNMIRQKNLKRNLSITTPFINDFIPNNAGLNYAQEFLFDYVSETTDNNYQIINSGAFISIMVTM